MITLNCEFVLSTIRARKSIFLIYHVPISNLVGNKICNFGRFVIIYRYIFIVIISINF